MINSSRREVLGAMLSLGIAATCSGTARVSQAAEKTPGEGTMQNVKALIFDVFGTLVDWRNGVARKSQRVLEPLGHKLD